MTKKGNLYFIGMILFLGTFVLFPIVSLSYCFYVFKQHNKATADIDYPAYGVVGPAFKKPSIEQYEENNKEFKEKNLNQEKKLEKSSSIINSPNNQRVNVIDKKIAQSAQLYHYHHQKQQMIESEKNKNLPNTSNSDIESEEENEEGDYTVYECPGLASTGEIEVNNPLFKNNLSIKEQK